MSTAADEQPRITTGSAELADELDRVLRHRALYPHFQPIVDLATGEPVAFEALARGPEGSPLHRPDRLFATALRVGRLAELDQLCRRRALEAVLASDVRSPYAFFLNREPATVTVDPMSATGLDQVRAAGLRGVVELTERALTHDPALLLAYADQVRAAGLGLALDDVGAEAESLALMPFLRPDVVKLDLHLVQGPLDVEGAMVVAAVQAYAQESGAVILAEGIETEEHERIARGLGATLGQGWRYGRPAALPVGHARTGAARTLPRPGTSSSPAAPAPQRPLRLLPSPLLREGPSPFEAVAARTPVARGDKETLLALREVLEVHATRMERHAVVLTTCMEAPDVSPECARHYGALAASSAYTAAVGATMPDELVPGLRGARLTPTDPVGREWDLVVVGPHFAGALVSRLRDARSPDGGLELDYALTYDRTLVLEAARSLMRRALPLDAPTDPVVADLLEDGTAAAA